MKKRLLILIALSVIATFVLAACESGNSGNSSNSGGNNATQEASDNGQTQTNNDNKQADSNNKQNAETSYWYIDNEFKTAVGQTIIFKDPDAKGLPTKIILSGYNDEEGNNGEFVFEADQSSIIVDSDPWIMGHIVGGGNLFLKAELMDSNGKVIGVDIYF